MTNSETRKAKIKLLADELYQSIDEFNEVQKPLLEIKGNIERNKKIINALMLENEKIQEKIETIQVSETGEISLDGFDDNLIKIEANNRKIEIIQNVIKSFENQLEYRILTTFLEKRKALISKKTQHQNAIVDDLFFELLDENFISKLSKLYYICKEIDFFDVSDRGDGFKKLYFEKLIEYINAVIREDSAVILEEIFIIPEIKLDAPNIGIFGRSRRIDELEKELSK